MGGEEAGVFDEFIPAKLAGCAVHTVAGKRSIRFHGKPVFERHGAAGI